MANQSDLDTLIQSIGVLQGVPYMPTRKLTTPLSQIPARTLLNSIVALQANAPPTTPIGANTQSSSGGGAPEQLLSLAASERPVSAQNTTQSQVAVTFTRDGSDINYAATRIWFTGYKGSTIPQLMTQGTDSPILFVVDSTDETVVVTAQPIGSDGTSASFAGARTCTVTLDGVLTAPPAPSIAQTLVGTALGYQFAFNQLPAQLDDVIDGYQIYRNTTGILDGSQAKIQYIKHNPTNSSAVVVTDTVVPAAGVFYYYWVSAVDTAKLESTLTAAQSVPTVGSIGSVPPAIATPFSIKTTSSSMTVTTSPTAYFTRADGTSTTIGATTLTVTGLVNNNTYSIFPYWRETDQTLQWVKASDVTIPNITGILCSAASSQWVETTTSASIGAAFSFEIWMNGSTASNQALMSYSAPQGTGTVTQPVMQAFVTSAGEITFTLWNGAAWHTVTTAGASVLDGSWHQIVCTYDSTVASGTMTVWVDNADTSDGVTFWTLASIGTTVTASAYWHIGFIGAVAGSSVTTNLYNSLMLSHAAVYPAALSTNSIGAHFIAFTNISSTGYDSEVVYDLATSYWKLNETSGTTAADSIGSNTGTYEGSPTLNQTSPIVSVEGTPATAWPFPTLLALQFQTLRTHVPLSSGAITVKVTAGGTSSGGGSGGGTGSKGGVCFTGDTLIKTRRGAVAIRDIIVGDEVLTAKGTWRTVYALKRHEPAHRTLHVIRGEELVTYDHKILIEDEWVNAGDVFTMTKESDDAVYTLSILTSEPESQAGSATSEHSYTLECGVIASNFLGPCN